MRSFLKIIREKLAQASLQPISGTNSFSISAQMGRFISAERDLGIPVRFVYVILIYNYLFFPVGDMPQTNEVLYEAFALAKKIFIIYVTMNLIYFGMLLYFRRIPYRPLLYATFLMAMLDGLMFCCLIVIEDGFSSSLYWVYFGMMLRNAYAISDPFFQITLNLSIVFLYFIGGLFSDSIFSYDQTSGSWLLAEQKNNSEQVALRLMLLFLMVIFCFWIQVLFDREKKFKEEQLELKIRNEHLNGVGKLVAEIAHQLKNPLSIINNAAYILQKNQSDPDLIRTQAGVIRQEITRSDLILKDLMTDAAQSVSSVKKLSVGDELQKSVARALPEGTFPEIDLELIIPGNEDLYLFIKPSHIAEILDNLLVNAREAVHGSGRIQISVTLSPNSDIVIKISDSGPGIDPKLHTRVFESFFSTKEKGTGLGLGIVKKYIEFYNGKISLDSSDSGTTFTVWFPRTITATTTF